MPAKVMLNIYDLSPQNQYTYWCGLGVFHAGVEVYGIEWAYGGHDYDYSGVFATNPKDAPGQVLFRESVCMGETELSQAEVERLVQQLGTEFKGNKYHLLQRNCNHFADDLCQRLVGKELPLWINRLASIAVMLHCLLPPTWVPSLETPSGPAAPPYTIDAPTDTQALIQDSHSPEGHDYYSERATSRQDYFQDRLRAMPTAAAAAGAAAATPVHPALLVKSPPGSGILSDQL